MATKSSSKTLAVYVIGMSGSIDYVGCGKSSMCRQFVYDEYMEESCSTLLRSEFDSVVINQQHTIYWGQKTKTYMCEATTPFVSDTSITVNFEIFEHTIFYEDGTNLPYRGHEKYEKRVFTPLKSFVNKYAFKSRDEVLNPEEYGSRKFLYSKDTPVAYLYAIDVSQPFSIFQEQLELMDKLVKSVQKKHFCVIVASKFDTHSRGSVESLEKHAGSLKVPVIHCSAKFNTNVHTAFRNLAMKALSLKKIVTDKPAKVPAPSTLGQKDELISPRKGVVKKSSKGPSIVNNIPPVPPRDKTLTRNNRSKDNLNERRFSLSDTSKFVKLSDHHITLPVKLSDLRITSPITNNNQSTYDTYMNFPSKAGLSKSSSKMSNETDSDLHCKPAIPRCDMPLPPLPDASSDDCTQSSIRLSSETLNRSMMPLQPTLFDAVASSESKEKSIQQNSEKLDKSSMPLPSIPLVVVVSNDSNSEKLNRSMMPLPPTPLDAVVSNDSNCKKLNRSSMPLPPTPLDAVASNDSNSEKLNRSTMPLPPTPLDAVASNDSNSEKLNRSTMPLPPTPLDAVVSNDSNSEKLNRSTMPLPPIPLDAVVSNDSKEKSIQQNSEKLDRSSMPLPLTPLEVVVLNGSTEDLLISTPVTLFGGAEGDTLGHKNMKNGSTDDAYTEEYSSSSDGYEKIDFELLDEVKKSLSPLPSTADGIVATVDDVTITNSDRENCMMTDKELNIVNDSDTDQMNESATDISTPLSSLEVKPASATVLSMANKRTANDNETAVCLDKDYVISDYEFYSMQIKQQASLTTDRIDDVLSSNTPVYLELKGLDPALGDYIVMHRVDSQSQRKDSQVLAYDYVYHPYIKMCRQKLRQSGVPPRRVEREGYTPSVAINTNPVEKKHVCYVNIEKSLPINDTALLPPRASESDTSKSSSEDRSDAEPTMPPRNISRPRCYLSAPSAIPT